jgi:hypothetical protein
MRSIITVLLVGVGAAASHAQELLPELAVWAGKHTAAVAEVERLRGEAVTKAAQPYVSVLDGVERTATAKGEIDLVAAIVKEREAVVAGALEPDLPTTLPKAKLQASRKALQAKVEQVNADFAKRHKQADADYLKALATLQAKATPELAKQVAAEKARLLADSTSVSGGGIGGSANTKASPGKNVVVNGDFEKVVDGEPEGWPHAKGATIERENGNAFLRIEKEASNKDGSASLVMICQNLSISAGAKKIYVSGRLRTTGCVKCATESPNVPLIQVQFKNEAGKSLSYIVARWGMKNGGWKSIQSDGAFLKGVTTAELQLVNGRCPGQIDFDDLKVTFK